MLRVEKRIFFHHFSLRVLGDIFQNLSVHDVLTGTFYAIQSTRTNNYISNHILDRYRVDADDEDVPNLRPIPKVLPLRIRNEKDLEVSKKIFTIKDAYKIRSVCAPGRDMCWIYFVAGHVIIRIEYVLVVTLSLY